VPIALACALGATGCYLFHEREVGVRPTATDGGAARVRDAGARSDAGSPAPDAAVSECRDGTFPRPLAPRLVCGHTIDGVVRAGLAQELVAVADGCHCAGTISCTAEITGAHELTLTTLFCDDPSIDCDCFEEHPVTRFDCRLPPLAPGSWSVTVDDRVAFLLESVDGPVPTERPGAIDVCWTTSPREDPEARACAWPSAADLAVERFCHENEAVAGTHVAIEVEGLSSCEHDRADCEVVVVADEIRVAPRVRACGGPCPTCELCAPIRHACATPALPPGEYRVRSGSQVSRLLLLSGGVPRPGTTCSRAE